MLENPWIYALSPQFLSETEPIAHFKDPKIGAAKNVKTGISKPVVVIKMATRAPT